MRATALAILCLTLLFSSAFALPRSTELPVPLASEAEFVRGVALGLFATDPDWNYGPMVDEMAGRGATDVLVVVNAYQSNRFASDITQQPGPSPSNATVVRTIRQVRRAGMRAAVMPVVRLEARARHEWRGVIAPADGLDAWFTAYRRFVLPLARIAETEGAARFIVGSELSSLERYEHRWRRLIDDVRDVFSGRLTYSANWDHADEVPFWDALDELGLTAYFPLSSDATPSPESLARAWRAPLGDIRALARRVGKRVVITEVGYTSQRYAAVRPWDDTSPGGVDLRAQQQLYRSFCDAFTDTPSVSGFYVWNWFGFGGPRDAGFTPRGKPAATELAACFARAWAASATTGNRR